MKANELMVGNFVWADGGIVIVREIGEKQTDVWLDDKRPFWNYKFCSLMPNDWLQPIPITEEWLAKQGFKHEFDELCEFNYYIREIDGYFVDIQLECANMGEGYVTCHIDNCDRCTVASADIQYVHQLQNLLNIMNIKFDVEL